MKSVKCRFSLLVVFALILAWAADGLNAMDSKWSLTASGIIQGNGGKWVHWYTINASTLDSESAANGTQGISAGLQFGLECKLANWFGLEGVVSCIPTRLFAEVHWTSRNLFAQPKENLLFFPARIAANFYFGPRGRWNLFAGPQVGIGLFGETDVRPEFGRARHFNGKNRLLLGGHVGTDYGLSPGHWSLWACLQYMRAVYEVSELDTGDLRQELYLNAIQFGLGVRYRF
ncbi:MAG: hypothetical protein JXI33_02260 [Candidatus Aminicenantes bacterium]|nr:hypothetical protein [Candidatus Aminicenantes bacterium]